MAHVGISYWPVGGNQTKQRVFRALSDVAEVTFLDPNQSHPDLSNRGFDLYHLAKRRRPAVADLHRAAAAGIPTLNPPSGVSLTSDRLATLDVLRRAAIPVPDYEFAPANRITLEPPFVVKTRHETDTEAHDHDFVFEGFPTYRGPRLVQQYIASNRHLKVYRIGDEIRVVELGAARGIVRRELPARSDLRELTDQIAAFTGLSLFEADILDGPTPYVVDVNPVVSLAGVSDAESLYLQYLTDRLSIPAGATESMAVRAELD